MKPTYELLQTMKHALTNNNLSNATCEEVLVSVLDEHLCFSATFSVEKGINGQGEYCSEMVIANYYIPVTYSSQFSEIKLTQEVIIGLIRSLEEEQKVFLDDNEVH